METDLKSYRSEFAPVSCNQGLSRCIASQISADYVLDLPQVDLINFRVEYVRPRSARASDELKKQDEGLFRKSNDVHIKIFSSPTIAVELSSTRRQAGGQCLGQIVSAINVHICRSVVPCRAGGYVPGGGTRELTLKCKL